ncbi:unnamed protein product [Brachionus calyciflorus]|uniref:PiggyBac transposable element-derived protein domain-containing protein n=1 Tax=Brachionus calyciflorus TaxID=104777 RepID=A0A814C8B4_9BILA|nr:unnamed protein product [Brachionus calyciflorus]
MTFLNEVRKTAKNAKECIRILANIETDDSDGGSEYEDEDFFPEEVSDLDDENDDENEEDEDEQSNKKIDECIEAVIHRSISDQSVGHFDSTADKTSKVGVVWNTLELDKSKRVINRIKFNGRPGPTAYAARRVHTTALSAFEWIIDTSIINFIINSTNQEAKRCNASFRLNIEIFYCFIGVLFCRAVFCNGVAVRALWSRLYALPIIVELMSKVLFCKVMRFLRFDEKNTRKTRRSKVKFCLIREVWERFIINSQKCFNPSQFLTADEQLLQSKSRCSFIQYMSSKPDKFGIKFWNLVDVKSKYLVNSFPYLGKETDKEAGILQGEYVIKKLMQPFFDLGHCIQQERITIYNKDKQPLYKSLIFEHDTGALLTIYQGKAEKNVSVLSTFHDSVYIDPKESTLLKNKTKVIIDYNEKKVGVNTVDQMTRIYLGKAPSRRWLMQVFYNLLNLACINSWVL